MSYAPGWYPDGAAPRAERWFDGVGWTASTRTAERVAGGHWSAPYTPAGAPQGAPYGVPMPFATAGLSGQVPAQWCAPTPVGHDPSDPVHWLIPVGRSWQSIAAGYVGLIGLLVFPIAPFAIWLGIWALMCARRGGHGRGRAIFGILTGVIGTVFLVMFLLWVLFST